MKISTLRTIAISVLGLFLGVLIGSYFFIFKYQTPLHFQTQPQKQVIGFLPYWLLNRAKTDDISYLTTLTYFGLNVDGDGHIVKLTNPQEENPGWYALESGKLKPFFASAKENNIKLSLLLASGDADAINQLLNKPVEHANTLVKEISPLMKRYGFSDLNLDIEYTSQASSAARVHFTQFVQTVKQQLTKQQLATLTIEISPNDVIKNNLIDTKTVAPFADTIVLMAYDYHSPDSFVTGAVAPLNGAGVNAEYDVTTAVEKTMQLAPPAKIVLGVPLYGYEWETLSNAVHSAVIPGTGVLASANRMESFLTNCATCSAFFDTDAQEEYITYKDPSTGTFHEIFSPDEHSLQAKIDLANKSQLNGVGLWALGYEGNSTLKPLANYQ